VLTLYLLGHARPPIRSPGTPVSQSLHASLRKPGSHNARSLLSPRTPLTLCRDEHQQQTLEAFRAELLQDGLIPQDREAAKQSVGYDRYDDTTLLRFLRARKFDIPASKAMWQANEKWRKEFGTDEIAA
jgi:hypothetical protein